jgi:predicted HicB family RNase H-like nuclease
MAMSSLPADTRSPLALARRNELRIPEDVWRAAVRKAQEEGTSVTAVVTAALRRYLTRPPR